MLLVVCVACTVRVEALRCVSDGVVPAGVSVVGQDVLFVPCLFTVHVRSFFHNFGCSLGDSSTHGGSLIVDGSYLWVLMALPGISVAFALWELGLLPRVSYGFCPVFVVFTGVLSDIIITGWCVCVRPKLLPWLGGSVVCPWALGCAHPCPRFCVGTPYHRGGCGSRSPPRENDHGC